VKVFADSPGNVADQLGDRVTHYCMINESLRSSKAATSASKSTSALSVAHTGCCGHSVAAFTASTTRSLIFDPNASGTGISVFSATP
jgi:hypothetical protein